MCGEVYTCVGGVGEMSVGVWGGIYMCWWGRGDEYWCVGRCICVLVEGGRGDECWCVGRHICVLVG